MNSETTEKEQKVDKRKGMPHLYKKGQSGNPEGRPKGSGISITTEIKKKLAKVPQGEKLTYLQLLIDKIMDQALKDGDKAMIRNIWNYIDGMPKQSSEVTLTVPIPILGNVHKNQSHIEAGDIIEKD